MHPNIVTPMLYFSWDVTQDIIKYVLILAICATANRPRLVCTVNPIFVSLSIGCNFLSKTLYWLQETLEHENTLNTREQ